MPEHVTAVAWFPDPVATIRDPPGRSKGRSYYKQLAQGQAGGLQCLQCLQRPSPLSTHSYNTVVRGGMLFVPKKNAARLNRRATSGRTEAVKPWKTKKIASNDNRFCLLAGVPKVCLGVRPPVHGGCAVLCSVVINLRSSLFAVLFGAARPSPRIEIGGRRTGFAATVPTARGRQAAAWNDLACILEGNTRTIRGHTLAHVQALVSKRAAKTKLGVSSLTHQRKFH